jgi:hypothetical protein
VLLLTWDTTWRTSLRSHWLTGEQRTQRSQPVGAAPPSMESAVTSPGHVCCHACVTFIASWLHNWKTHQESEWNTSRARTFFLWRLNRMHQKDAIYVNHLKILLS